MSNIYTSAQKILLQVSQKFLKFSPPSPSPSPMCEKKFSGKVFQFLKISNAIDPGDLEKNIPTERYPPL